MKKKKNNERHTGETVSRMVNETLEKFNISSKVFSVVRDGGSNMVAGFRNGDMISFYCFAHRLQLIIKTNVLNKRSINDAVARCKNFVSHIHKSSNAADEFRKIQKSLHRKETTLPQDVDTRWDSLFYMLERLLEEKSPVVMFSSENAHPGRDISFAKWKLIEQVVELLRPFKQATKEAQFRSSSISMVIPTILGLISFLEDAVTLPSFELVKGAAEDFLFDLNRRFSKSAVLENQ